MTLRLEILFRPRPGSLRDPWPASAGKIILRIILIKACVVFRGFLEGFKIPQHAEILAKSAWVQ